MYEIDTNSVVQWYESQQDKTRKPIYIDVDCPNCSKSMVNRMINQNDWQRFSSLHLTRYSCAMCEKTSYLILIARDNDADSDGPESRLFIYPAPSFVPELSDALKAMSPRLENIYEQSLRAEAFGFNELAGMGYRKALEFLIKDYALKNYPDDATRIMKMKLAQCIETYVGSPKLKQAAKSTAALGNDETHYERRFPQQELRELGGFLKATIEWLEHDLSLDSFIAESARDK